MKHVHVLPTDKPSTLFKDDFGKLIYSINMDQEQNHFEPQHLFITSDEEIKEGDWFYDLGTKYIYIKQSWENSHLDFNGKKIILTTDPDLIKDGVQAIDDEFLEWFVKNPSCEEVDVKPMLSNNGRVFYGYKIIIPKEEPKQETLEEEFKFKNRQMGAAGFVGNKIMENMISKFKQETLEEASKDYIENTMKFSFNSLDTKTQANRMLKCAEFGAKWQAERMYSEEEVFNLCREFAIFVQRKGPSYKKQQEWFEQFKKK